MQLKDRVALITGAGSGIGKAAALLLAKEGAKIGALTLSEEEARQTAEEIRMSGGEAVPIAADISKVDDIQRAIKGMVDRWGRLEVVFANAGINGVWAGIEELMPEDWDTTLNTNLRGTFLTIKHAVPYLKRQGGSVIVTSSVNGTRMFSNTGASAYATSKAGQVALTKMLALELADEKIRVNVICPGWIETQISDNTEKRSEADELRPPVQYPEGAVPLTHGGPGSPEQVAQLVLFLASDASSHITGTEIYIDGGQSLFQG
jgi:NAD(P)-dependent dehydrogenase (short-subunit alcohol dehydrogenase family)